jgi:branched-chain amino acid transport system substrate-binding protein
LFGITTRELAYDERGDLRDGTITVYRVEGGEWKVLETSGSGGR